MKNNPVKPEFDRWLDRHAWALPKYCVVLSQEQYELAHRAITGKDAEDSFLMPEAWGLTHQFEEQFSAIVALHPKLANMREPGLREGVIAHEASHVLSLFFSHINEDKPSEEFIAYGMQQIVKQVTNEYRRIVKVERETKKALTVATVHPSSS